MPQRIKIHTDFDITNTGVVRNFRQGMLPCKVSGKSITSEAEWVKLRRQQANWETLIQVISLRTQPLNIRTAVNKANWTLEFDIDLTSVYHKGDDPLGLLKDDIENVPMLTGLDEHKDLDSHIVVDKNVSFELYEI